MSYEELKREISSRSTTQLAGLLMHVARLCGIKSVFKDKVSMLEAVGRAYEIGPVGEAELRDESPPPPDPFEEWWLRIDGDMEFKGSLTHDIARAGWEAAVKHMEGRKE